MNGTNTVETVRERVKKILRQYHLRWEDIAPDRDQLFWANISPQARRARKSLFRKRYPSLYAGTPRNKTSLS